MQIIRVTSHCIMTFEKTSFMFKSSQTIVHNHKPTHTHTSAISVIFYCYMLQNRQAHGHSLCIVMSHVIFAYRIMMDTSTRSKKFCRKSYVVNLSDLCSAIKKILGKISGHRHL